MLVLEKVNAVRIISWNVNGLNACRKKGFDAFLERSDADFFCCQEIKTKPMLQTPKYHQYWNLCQTKKGYSGTLVLAKKKPLSVHMEIGEGRCITLEYENFILINVYVPNAESGLERKEARAD